MKGSEIVEIVEELQQKDAPKNGISKKKVLFKEKINLKLLLVGSFILLAGLAASVVGFVSFQKTSSLTYDLNTKDLMTEANGTMESMDAEANGWQAQINLLSQDKIFGNLSDLQFSGNQMMDTFKSIHDAIPDFENVYYGSTDKDFVLYPKQDLPQGYDPTTRPWYQQAIANPSQAVWTEPYINATDNTLIVTLAKAVTVNGTVEGVVAADVSLKSLTDKIQATKIGNTGYLYIASSKGAIIAHPDSKLLGYDVNKDASLKQILDADKNIFTYSFGTPPAKYVQAYTTSPLTGWKYGAVITVSEMNAAANSLRNFTVISIVIVVVLAMLVAIFLASSITRPVESLMYCMDRISKGDLSCQSQSSSIKEINHLWQSYLSMVNNIREQVLHMQRMASGDLTVELAMQSNKDELGQSLISLVDNLNDLIKSIQKSAEQVASGSNLVSNSSMTLSQGVTEQASTIEQLTASFEEISKQTDHNAQTAEKVSEIIRLAKENAANGTGHMKSMLNAMAEINESSGKINNIIKVIDDIAFQTNILALNAAVEAARAGQYGKGFAVVAEEVRNLAAKSANAAKETTGLIENSIRKVEIGTKIANDTASALDKIALGVDNATDLAATIAISSQEQASSIQQINIGVSQLSQVVQINAATAEESAAASEELSSQAEQLKQTVSIFKIKKELPMSGNVNTLKNKQAIKNN
jgi:methyl-accepting chemotaxis protein